MAAGVDHHLALGADGSLWAWGSNEHSQLADGVRVSREQPTRVGSGYRSIAASQCSSLLIDSQGRLSGWGLAFQPASMPPSATLLGGDFAAASIGWGHILALKTDGSLWAWGSNSSGERGNGTTTSRSRPQRIGSDFTAAAAGGAYPRGHSVALNADGSVWTWGDNRFGQLGDGTTNNGLRRRPVADGPTLAIAAGDAHTLAIRGDVLVWAWDSRFQGQPGNGGFAKAVTATDVVGTGGADCFDLLPGTAKVAGGQRLHHFLAMEKAVDGVRSSLADRRTAGLFGDIYFSALLPADSPRVGASAANSGLAAARSLRAAGAARADPAPASAKGPLPLVAAARQGRGRPTERPPG